MPIYHPFSVLLPNRTHKFQLLSSAFQLTYVRTSWTNATSRRCIPLGSEQGMGMWLNLSQWDLMRDLAETSETAFFYFLKELKEQLYLCSSDHCQWESQNSHMNEWKETLSFNEEVFISYTGYNFITVKTVKLNFHTFVVELFHTASRILWFRKAKSNLT